MEGLRGRAVDPGTLAPPKHQSNEDLYDNLHNLQMGLYQLFPWGS